MRYLRLLAYWQKTLEGPLDPCLFTPTGYISCLIEHCELTEGVFWSSGINTLIPYTQALPFYTVMAP